MSKLRNYLFLSFFIMLILLTGIVSSVHAAAFTPAVNSPIPSGAGPSSVVKGQFVTSHMVSSNAAVNRPVTATNTPAFGTPGLITNNVSAPEGTAWNNATYAVELNEELRIDLGQPYSGINRVVVQVDDNDTYSVEYSLDGLLWTTLYNVPVSIGGGLRTRDSGIIGAVSARYIRIYATGGDGFYSVSELQILASGAGILDAAVANFEEDTVTVMLGNGDGTFATSDFASGTKPYAVISADFDGDGNADLAVANSGSNDITILFGDGTGDFPSSATYPVGTTPYSLTSGDFDGDGFIDIAVANLNSGNVSILIGDGAGTFVPTSPAVFPAGNSPASIVAADFYFDEVDEFDVPIVKDELAVADSRSNTVSILSLKKNLDSTYTMTTANQYTVGSTPLALVTGDFNGDGMPDIAVANANSANVSILLGIGSNLLMMNDLVPVDPFPASVTAADLNGDGKIDLAVTHLSGNTVSVLYGNYNGKFQQPLSFPTGRDPLAVAAGDFDGDGLADLLTANNSGDNLSLLINTPNTGINLTSPSGGEHIQGGTTHTITWDALPGAVSYRVYYSSNNGLSFKQLAKVGSVTSYSWKVSIPTVNLNDNLIKVVGYDASKRTVGEGRSKSTFSIEAMRIVFPNGGEIGISGGTAPIGWEAYTTSRTPTTARLSYWNGGSWVEIATLNPIPFPPMYNWVLPAVTETRHFYLLKVELRAGSKVVATDVTDRFFTIMAP